MIWIAWMLVSSGRAQVPAVGETRWFADGRSFVIGERLGKGRSATVFAIDENVAIRIPFKTRPARERMARYRRGWQQVKAMGAPVVAILDPENERDEYQLVERVAEIFDFWKYLDFVRHPGTLEADLGSRAERALETFAAEASRVARLGDCQQMLFDGIRWRLHDFIDEGNISAAELPTQSLFSEIPAFPPAHPLAVRLHDLTLKVRLTRAEDHAR